MLEAYMNGEGAPDPAKRLWETRFYENEFFMKVYMLAEVSNLESQQATEREAFFKQSRDAWKEIKHTLQLLEKHITLPYTLGNYIYQKILFKFTDLTFTGDQLSLVDLHLGAWFARILHLIRAPYTPSGKITAEYVGFDSLQETIRRNTGDVDFIVSGKIRDLCVAIMNRKSWQNVYKDGLH